MASLNKVLLMGNLTRDIEMRYTPSGMAVARMGLAVSRKFRDSKTNELREEVCFVDIDVFGKQAETAHQYLSKGRPVFIEGRLKLDQWDDKQSDQQALKAVRGRRTRAVRRRRPGTGWRRRRWPGPGRRTRTGCADEPRTARALATGWPASAASAAAVRHEFRSGAGRSRYSGRDDSVLSQAPKFLA